MKSMDSTSSAIDQQLSVIESVVGDGADLDGYSTLMRRGVNLTTILLADALAEGDSISDAGSASVGNIVSAVLSARGFLRGDSESAVNRITEATTLMDVLSKVLLDGAYVGQITRMCYVIWSSYLRCSYKFPYKFLNGCWSTCRLVCRCPRDRLRAQHLVRDQ